MADATVKPRLRLGFFKLPSNASFVPRTANSMGSDPILTVLADASNVVAPRYAWSQRPFQFLDDIFTLSQTPLSGGGDIGFLCEFAFE